MGEHMANVTERSMYANTTMVNVVVTERPNDTISDAIWAARVGIFGIGGTTIAIFGLVGNIISIIVLSQYRQKSSSPLLLILLALFDLFFLGSELVLETLATIAKAELISKSYIDWLRPGYVRFFTLPFIAQTGTTFMVVLITTERYIAVAKPFLASRICKKSVAAKASAVVLVWCIVYNIPRYMAYTFYDQWRDETNTTRVNFTRTSFGESFFYNEVYLVWINLSLRFLLPCTILVVLNTLLLRALMKSKKLEINKTQPKSRKDGQRLTAMVLAVTTMFFFCELFPAISLIWTRGVNRYYECSLACNNFVSLSDTMVIVNSACNFMLYCAVGKRFRDIFLKLFCHVPFRKVSSSGSNSNNTRPTTQTQLKTYL